MRILCLFGLCFGLLQTTNAQTLTLQIPLSRASHTFSLWELNADPNDTSGYERPSGISALDIPGGWYQKQIVPPLSVIGYTGSNGEWIPSALQGSLTRTQNATAFFVTDDTSGDIVHANTTALLNAMWIPNLGTDPIAYYSLPANRNGHQFLLNASGTDPDTMQSWSGWWSLSTGAPIEWFGGNSAHFFEAWTSVPRWIEAASVYDISSGEYRTVPGLVSDLSDPNAPWLPAGSGFWPAVAVFIATAQNGGDYELLSPYGAPQMLSSTTWSYTLSTYGVACVVGRGRDFWIRRVSDGLISPIWNIGWGVDASSYEIDATSIFGNGPVEDWQTLTFNVSASRDPWSWKVRRTLDGVETMITWDSSPTGTYVFDPTGTQTLWAEWYPGQVYVNVWGGWTLINGSSADMGQSSDHIDWPTFPGSSATLVIPRSRSGHAMFLNPGDTGLMTVGSFTGHYTDAFTSEPYSVELDTYSFETTGAESTPFRVIDQTVAETSSDFNFYMGQQLDLSTWHLSSNLILKVSATRWAHTLQILCGNGEIFSVSKHKIQGDWSFDPVSGQSWFNEYGFFDATAKRRADVPWHLYDATTGEYLTSDGGGDETSFVNSVDNTDTDGDGLEDWYEHLIGTDPNDSDTDNDGTNDGAEVANGTNPRAASAASDPNSTLKVFTPLE